MGYFKQLHIDCYDGECLVNQEETCYMQADNPSYYEETEPPEDIEGSDRNPAIDMDLI
jgi:hypothetical protein